MLAALCTCPSAAAASHCARDETALFNCSIKGSADVASLCASHDLDATHGRLTYRYGPSDRVDLAFPDDATGSPQDFRIAHYGRFQTEYIELSFDHDATTYTLFDYFDGTARPHVTRGVRVTRPDGSAVERTCTAPVDIADAAARNHRDLRPRRRAGTLPVTSATVPVGPRRLGEPPHGVRVTFVKTARRKPGGTRRRFRHSR